MRISDWSSDVCSSDLAGSVAEPAVEQRAVLEADQATGLVGYAVIRGDAGIVVANVNHALARNMLDGLGGLGDQLRRGQRRSDERRVGQAWVSTGSSMWSPST